MRLILGLFGYAKVPTQLVQLCEALLAKHERDPNDQDIQRGLKALIAWFRSARKLG